MQIILHRKNSIEDLKNTPEYYGVEIDIRSWGKRLIVAHDPFVDAIDFEEWIKYFRHKILILNIKEEGIEYKVKEVVAKAGISDYFFLDLSFPYLIKMVKTGEKRVAVRFSEFEPLEGILALAGKADWAWVDCFRKFPLDQKTYEVISKYFKICLVSPELQGRDLEEIDHIRTQIKNFHIDAVCTKNPARWGQGKIK